MKRRTSALTTALIFLFCLFCAGCQSGQVGSNPATLPVETPPADTFPETDYTDYTDLELLYLTCDSGCLDEWGFSSDSRAYSIWGLVKIGESCPPLQALLGRESAVESIRLYAPALIEEYAASEEHVITSFALDDILYRILCPDLSENSAE